MITPSKSKGNSIRSNEECVLMVPKFKHDTFGKHAFVVYGPLSWNCLPKDIRLCDEIEAFKRNLKTHLIVKFVNEYTLATWLWRIIVKRPRMLSAQFVALYKPRSVHVQRIETVKQSGPWSGLEIAPPSPPPHPHQKRKTKKIKTKKNNNNDLNQVVLHLWSKFGDLRLNGWWVIVRTNFKLRIGVNLTLKIKFHLDGQESIAL